MIIVQLIGGLGNQMFQYAMGRSLAIHHNEELKLDIGKFKEIKGITTREYCLYPFSIVENFASQGDLSCVNKTSTLINNLWRHFKCALFRRASFTYIREKSFKFDSNFLNYPENIYLEGYWQTEKYFVNIEQALRNEFILKQGFSKNALILANHLQNDENAVSIHIRRGDYFSNKEIQKIHGCCSLKYYYDAMEKIIEFFPLSHFYLFSDDIPWVKNNFKTAYPVIYIEDINDPSACEELILMSLCKHHIISNSSYSWWGAWLSSNVNKMIIAPENWVNDASRDMSDLIPEGWIRISSA